jgi:aerobic-type carbon monoxide dehydrogenase small subunit (CoxS/CutS family)
MTDQPQPQPGGPGNSGSWQPVPGGGDYDPDQTMHVSFAAQLPPEPKPGEDPLSAHGPAGGERDAATQWSIPVIRDENDADSGEFSTGTYTSPWDQAPSPAPTQSFPPGMFGQGAAAAQAAAREAQEVQAQAFARARAAAEAQARADVAARAADLSAAGPAAEPAGRWAIPLGDQDIGGQGGLPGGQGGPWMPVDAAWSGVVDDPESADAPGPDAHRSGPGGGVGAHQPGAPYEDAPGESAATPAYEQPAGEPEASERGSDGIEAGAEATDYLAGFAPFDAFAGPGAEQPADPGTAADPESATDPGTVPETASEHGAGSAADPEPEAEPGPEPVEETRSEHPLASYLLRVNGADRPVTDAWLGESLLYVLRERLGLAGAKDGCEQGECGACSVQVDGRLVASCLVPAATAAGSDVRTVEGLSADGRPSDVQRALADCGAVQCGFCIPGLAMTVHDLLEGNHKPTDLETRQALSGNLCRCSGYRGVLDAVRQVVAGRESDAGTDQSADDPARVPHQGAAPHGGPQQSVPHQGGPVIDPPTGGAA